MSVILPYHGGRDEFLSAAAQLRGLQLAPGDEIIVGDNTPEGVAVACAADLPEMRIIATVRKRSAYGGRNEAAEVARNDWFLFTDADVELPPGLLDLYFSEPVPDDVGLVAGDVLGAPDQTRLAPRFQRVRNHLRPYFEHPFRPSAVTANLLVRRAAWEQVGGFLEGARPGGGDVDFCWRVQEAGWRMIERPRAAVHHRHRETLRALLWQSARDGAGGAWVNRRWGEIEPRPPLLRKLVRSAGGTLVYLGRRRFEDAKLKAVDGLWITARWLGYFADNVAPPLPDARPERADTVMVLDVFPDDAGAALARANGSGVRVEALRRPMHPVWRDVRAIPTQWAEDDGTLTRARALAWLARRRPLAVARNPRAAARVATVARRVARRGDGRVVVNGDSAELDLLRQMIGAR